MVHAARAVRIAIAGLSIAALGCGDSTVTAPRSSAPADASFPFDDASAHADGDTYAPSDAASDARDGALPVLPPPPSGAQMGATVKDDGGVAFRVWAPHASGVDVEGAFAAQPVALDAEDGGTFAGVVRAAEVGQSYRYIVHNGGASLPRLDPRAREIAGGDAVIVDPRTFPWASPAFTMAPKNASVVYELHVGSFGGDAASGAQGTFATVADRLDWLRDLGVTSIELMPANQCGSDVGWGYNPRAYFAPRASYGSSADLRRLVDAAHARGIGVILDVVYNHYDGSSQAPLRCFDGDCPQGGRGIYFFSDAAYATTPWGPRFDYASSRVSDFIIDGAFAWFAEYRIDGLRWDSTNNIRAIDGSGSVPGGADLLRRANDAVHALRPDALLIAEDLKGQASITAKSAAGGLGFDTQWDGFGPVVDAVVAKTDAARNLVAIRDALTWQYNGDPYARVLYTQSHDWVGNGGARLPQRIDPADPSSLAARKRSLLATAALLTAPAVPMLFMGEELLAPGTFAQTPAPLDWSLSTTRGPIVTFYRDAIRARRNMDGVTAGLLGSHVAVFHLNDAAKVIAYRRSDDAGNDVVVLLNFGATSFATYDVGLPRGGIWHVRLNSDDRKYSSDFGGASSADVVTRAAARDGFAATGSVALGAYAAVVLSP
jgi:1,4-alpha-glucan branching enzyme